MTASKLPAHGTVQRYRLELKLKREGRGEGACAKCRSANSARAKTARTNSAARARRATMAIVGDVTSDGHTDAPVTSPAPTTRGTAKTHRKRAMELAVESDIAAIDTAMQVPFHRSLTVLALELAREIDEPATLATARRDARKQLFEVLRSLRTQKEGDDASALTVLLEQAGIGVPLVPGRPA